MSNNKQIMKLYTEEQVNKVWKAGQKYWETSGASTTLEELLEQLTPIELPSDEEIHEKSIKYYTNITASFYFELGAKWMRDLIQRGNK